MFFFKLPMQNIYSCISKNSRCNVVDQRAGEERRASPFLSKGAILTWAGGGGQ